MENSRRTIESLQVLIQCQPDTSFTDGDKMTLKVFADMASEIAALKGGHKAANQENLAAMLEAIQYWKAYNKEHYQRVRAVPMEELKED
jgi:hypothetical protein